MTVFHICLWTEILKKRSKAFLLLFRLSLAIMYRLQRNLLEYLCNSSVVNILPCNRNVIWYIWSQRQINNFKSSSNIWLVAVIYINNRSDDDSYFHYHVQYHLWEISSCQCSKDGPEPRISFDQFYHAFSSILWSEYSEDLLSRYVLPFSYRPIQVLNRVQSYLLLSFFIKISKSLFTKRCDLLLLSLRNHQHEKSSRQRPRISSNYFLVKLAIFNEAFSISPFEV